MALLTSATTTTIPFIIKCEIQNVPCFNHFFCRSIFNEAPWPTVANTTVAIKTALATTFIATTTIVQFIIKCKIQNVPVLIISFAVRYLMRHHGRQSGSAVIASHGCNKLIWLPAVYALRLTRREVSSWNWRQK